MFMINIALAHGNEVGESGYDMMPWGMDLFGMHFAGLLFWILIIGTISYFIYSLLKGKK